MPRRSPTTTRRQCSSFRLRALLLALAVVMAASGAWPGILHAQSARPVKETIAVLALQPVDVSPAQASAITDRLSEELLRSGRYTLVDRSQIDAILNEQALQQTGCTEQECAVQVGRILGVRQMVAGKVTRVDEDLWQVSAILVDVETAETVRAESVRQRGGFVTLLESGIVALAAKLTAGKGPVAAMPRVPPAPPPPVQPPPPAPPAAESAEASSAPMDSLWLYLSAGALGLISAAQYADALDLHDQAQSMASVDPGATRQLESDRDAAATTALLAGAIGVGVLVWALNTTDDVASFEGPQPLLALVSQGGTIAPAIGLQLHW